MIDVLLATYNPNIKWLKAQVDSIRAQVGVEVNLICREDVAGVGTRENFSALLAESRAEYIAFSDQDDVWDPEKICRCLERMKDLESRYGRETPLLVFCDGRVANEVLEPYPGTAISRQGVNVKRGVQLGRLLMQNFISGNAMLFNAALREKAGSIPPGAIMHDAWIAIVAAAFGRLSFVDKPLYDYRQHSDNLVGATDLGVKHLVRRVSQGVAAFRARLMANVLQAQAFVARFGELTPPAVYALAGLLDVGWLTQRYRIVRHRLFKHGFLRNLALLLFS